MDSSHHNLEAITRGGSSRGSGPPAHRAVGAAGKLTCASP